MELGGSKTYTLTRLTPSPAVKPTEPIIEPANTIPNNANIAEITVDSNIAKNKPDITECISAEIKPPDNSVPIVPMILFFIGILLAVGGLLYMRALKKRREYYEDDDDDEYDNEK